MDLYIATLQVVPMLYIGLFINQRNSADEELYVQQHYRVFHFIVAFLGLVAFSLSVVVVGTGQTPQPWIESVVVIALACAMAALSARAFTALKRKKPAAEKNEKK